MPKVIFQDLGLIDYKQAWDYQEKLLHEIVTQKLSASYSPNTLLKTPNYFLYCQHPHVYTLGKSGKEDHLLLNQDELNKNEASFYKINRGGDITYHGPGQIVGYPILNLDYFFNDIHKYLRFLEEAIILTIAEYGLAGTRVEKLTGVWIDADKEKRIRKICAFGVRCSRWVTMHGFALNVNTDLNYFNNIVPCGIRDKAVTSMEKEIGKKLNFEEVKFKLKSNFAKVFDIHFVEQEIEQVEIKK